MSLLSPLLDIFTLSIADDEKLFDKEDWRKITQKNFALITSKTKEEIFHCYKDKDGVKVFLEDYVYFSQLMINLYETTGKISYLDDAIKTMDKTWKLFYDNKNKILQKNPIKQNDLFVAPSDINDHNIPNGNSIFLMNAKKLELITGEKKWKDISDELIQSFHSFLNLHSSQIVSYIKTINICDELTTFTFFGNFEKYKNIQKYVKNKYLNSSTLIYREDPNDSYVIVCKNKTCSNKIKNLQELKSVEKDYVI